MFCSKCGTENDANAFRCVQCGEVVQPVPMRPVPQDPAESAGMRILIPIGRSGLAIAAGYAGLFSLLLFPAPFALILGILAVIDIKKNPKKHGMGRAVFGIVSGAICSVFLIVAIISFALAGK